MNIYIFYSWQSRTDERFNKLLIRNAINKATKKIMEENPTIQYKLIENLDENSGYVNIPKELEDKLNNYCDILVSDHTIINPQPLWIKFMNKICRNHKYKISVESQVNANVIQEENLVKTSAASQ